MSTNAMKGFLKPGLISMITNMEAYRMAKARITEVMMDDTSINVSKVDLVFPSQTACGVHTSPTNIKT